MFKFGIQLVESCEQCHVAQLLKGEHDHERCKKAAEEDGENQDPCQSMGNAVEHQGIARSQVIRMEETREVTSVRRVHSIRF